MTPPRPEPRRRRLTTATLALVLVGLLVGGAVVVVLLVAGRVRSAVGSFTHPAGSTTITQSVVVERMREVARLVTSETTLRDVVLYRNSRLGSTKRSLVVVTGRILTGFDLDRGTEVRVDQAGRRIHLTLPPSRGPRRRDHRAQDVRRGAGAVESVPAGRSRQHLPARPAAAGRDGGRAGADAPRRGERPAPDPRARQRGGVYHRRELRSRRPGRPGPALSAALTASGPPPPPRPAPRSARATAPSAVPTAAAARRSRCRTPASRTG